MGHRAKWPNCMGALEVLDDESTDWGGGWCKARLGYIKLDHITLGLSNVR